MSLAAAGVLLVLLVATLGEGGASVAGLLAWHGVLAAALVTVLVAGRASRSALAAGPTIAFGVFFALTVWGALTAPYAYAAWLALLEIAACAAVAWLAAVAGPSLLLRLAAVLPAAAALHGLLALGQWAFGDAARPAGTFLNTNHLSAWLGAAALVGAPWLSDPRRSRFLRLACSVVVVGALLVSGSRGALAGALVGAAWLAWRWRSRISVRQRRWLAVCALGTIALVGGRVVGRLASGDPYLFHRAKIWRASLAVLAEDPWRGSGPGQFAVAATRHPFADGEGPLRYDRAYHTAHSDLLRAPCETGVPAALALLAALVLAWAAIRRRLAAASGTAHATAATAALVALGVQGLVDNPSAWPAARLLAAALLGALLAVRRPRSPAPARLPRLALALAVAFVFLVGDVAPARAHALAAHPADRQELERAAQLNPLHPEYAMRLAEASVEAVPLDPERYAWARERAERAVRLQPADARYSWRLARLEARACIELFHDAGTRDRAYARFEEAARRAPGDVRIVIEHGRLALAVGDPDRARRVAERALAVEPLALPAHALLAEALVRLDPANAGRAEALLDRARAAESEHRATAATSRYAAELLTLDPRRSAQPAPRPRNAGPGESGLRLVPAAVGVP